MTVEALLDIVGLVGNSLFFNRDALDAATGLYNQVEESLHGLVMRSNKSLQHLEFLFTLRETEANISEVFSLPLVPPKEQRMLCKMKCKVIIIAMMYITFYRLGHGSILKASRF